MSSENSSDSGASATSSTGPSSGGGKLVIILSVVNLLATIGMLTVLFLSFKKEKERTAVEDIAIQTEHEDKKEGGHGEGGHGEGGEGGEHGGAGGGKAQVSKSNERMVALDQFTVNLSTPGSNSPKFVRVNISLEVPNDDTEGEVSQKNPQIRNAIIDLFNSKKPSDLSTVDGREYLKEEIKSSLNSFLISGKVKGVFFTSFSLSG